MGLDMYLNAKRYLSNFDQKEKEISEKINELLGDRPGVPSTPEDEESSFLGRVEEVVVRVAYWRKANHIHAWFVNHLQDGRDECQETYVSREALNRLVDTCNAILSTPEARRNEVAKELLPPQSGFFFGSTEIDEWYFQDLKDTVKMLTPLLDEKWHKEYSFYYHASW